MLRSNVAHPRTDIVEKELAIRSDWSGTVVSFRAPRALRDPAPPARLPWRGFGGAAAAATERRISCPNLPRSDQLCLAQRLWLRQRRRNTPLIPRLTSPTLARSNLVSSRCCSRLRAQRLPR